MCYILAPFSGNEFSAIIFFAKRLSIVTSYDISLYQSFENKLDLAYVGLPMITKKL